MYEADEQDALVELLEDFGFTNVAFKLNSSPYIVVDDNEIVMLPTEDSVHLGLPGLDQVVIL